MKAAREGVTMVLVTTQSYPCETGYYESHSLGTTARCTSSVQQLGARKSAQLDRLVEMQAKAAPK